MTILHEIGTPAMLEQLAEEAAELSHAAMKLARLYRGENPTPKTEKQCIEDLTEEVADVELCISELLPGQILDLYKIDCIKDKKLSRWYRRLLEAKE